MGNKNNTRFFIAMAWLISFLIMLLVFNAFLPQSRFEAKLDNIEQSVAKKDWDKAKGSMRELKEIYDQNRILLQAGNATEILTTFNYTMGQLDISIQNEQDAALEYIGGLRSSLEFVMEAFSGP